MKYAYTILYVEDVKSTLKFYENAFRFHTKFVTPEGDYGELISGDTTIAFASRVLAESNLSQGIHVADKSNKPCPIEIAFVSDSIEKDFEEAIAAGATRYEDIKTKPWGQKVGYLLDLNGFLIEICTPMPAPAE